MMNKKQTIVLWLVGILCVIAFYGAFPRDFRGGGEDYAFNKLSAYATNLLTVVPAILIIGGVLLLRLARNGRKTTAAQV